MIRNGIGGTSRDLSDISRWAICGAVVLGCHVGAAAVLAGWRDSGDPGQSEVISIEIAAMPAAPKAVQEDLAIAPQIREQEPEPEKTEPPKEVIDEKPPEPTVEKPPDIPPVKAEIPLPAPEKPKPEPKPKPKRVAVATSPKPTERIDDKVVSPQAGTTNGRPTSGPSWASLVSAHLQAYKRYPSGATEHGVATVAFSIDSNGRLVSASLAHSSGVPALDQEVVAMVRRASPFPRAPNGEAGKSFTVPVNFSR